MTISDELFNSLVILVVVGLAVSWLFQKMVYLDMIGLLKTFFLFLFTLLFLLSLGYFVYKKIQYDSEEKNMKQKSNKMDKLIQKETIFQKSKQCDSEKENESKIINNLIPKTQAEQQSEAVKPVITIKVDEYKGCYKHKYLSIHDVKYLLNKGYQQIKLKSIFEKKPQFYLIKPRFNESINHMFLVYDIAEFLEKKGVETKKFITKKPDIVFELNNKRFAVEVETGTLYKTNKKQLLEKVESLNNEYDFWFFVLSDKNYIKKYRKLGKVIDKRYLPNQLNRLVRKAKIST
jgi:hypothetical protein